MRLPQKSALEQTPAKIPFGITPIAPDASAHAQNEYQRDQERQAL
jgi:hypothetical protein